MDRLSKQDVETHSTILGWLQIGYGALWMVVGGLLVTLILGVGMLIQDAVAQRILAMTASAVGGLLILLSVPMVVAGIGLLRRAAWSRILALVMAVFELAAFPIGTFLAGYTAFVLSQHAAPEVFGPCCALEENRPQAAPA